ncbi:MAG: hypothetical protein ABSC03_00340 [Verrucomicrobiota bacterium]|jgi:hypothetical protein
MTSLILRQKAAGVGVAKSREEKSSKPLLHELQAACRDSDQPVSLNRFFKRAAVFAWF